MENLLLLVVFRQRQLRTSVVIHSDRYLMEILCFEFNNRQLMCDIYNIHIQKILQAFQPNSMKLKNGYYESCFCGFTMWRNRRLWFMLLFSLRTCSESCLCFSQVWKEVSQTHEYCSCKPACEREAFKIIFWKQMYFNFNVLMFFVVVIGTYYVKKERTYDLSPDRAFKVSVPTKRAKTQFNKCQL